MGHARKYFVHATHAKMGLIQIRIHGRRPLSETTPAPLPEPPVPEPPPGGGKPGELDLSGKGSNITRLSSSNEFLDITASASLSLW